MREKKQVGDIRITNFCEKHPLINKLHILYLDRLVKQQVKGSFGIKCPFSGLVKNQKWPLRTIHSCRPVEKLRSVAV